VLIQANPPNIEYVLWMCTEFRHPSLLRGEGAFCLAQLSSAVEFCRNADFRGFDIPQADYNTLMLSYNSTLKLLLACKRNDFSAVHQLLECETAPADINGLSPDHKDSPLTACIRFNRRKILAYLLSRPGIDVDAPVQLFYGQNQRSSALIVATQYNQFEMVVDLLNAGADRTYCADSGMCAVTYAADHNLALVNTVLGADPYEYELTERIYAGAKLDVVGLLLQKVEVNYLAPNKKGTPLMAAVLCKDLLTIRLLLSKHLCECDVDYMSEDGDTALGLCIKEFVKDPSQDWLLIATMLLRAGADRYHKDVSHMSPIDYVSQAREAYKSAERELANPFVVDPTNLSPYDDLPSTAAAAAAAAAQNAPPPPPKMAPPPPPSESLSSAATVTAPRRGSYQVVQGSAPVVSVARQPQPSLPPPDTATGSRLSVKLPQEKEEERVNAEAAALAAEGAVVKVLNPQHKHLLKGMLLILTTDSLQCTTRKNLFIGYTFFVSILHKVNT
jgi:hypothetical protein